MSQLLTKKQLQQEYVNYSNTQLLRLEEQNLFPRRLKPNGGGRNSKAFWVREQVEDWIQMQIEDSDDSHNDSL